jgi:hypothetical protein
MTQQACLRSMVRVWCLHSDFQLRHEPQRASAQSQSTALGLPTLHAGFLFGVECRRSRSEVDGTLSDLQLTLASG